MINTNINSLKQFKVFDGCSHHGRYDSSRSRKYVLRRIEKFSTIQWTIPWGASYPLAPHATLRSEKKILRAHGGCLGTGSRRRTRQAAISPGERQTRFDPGVSEWGNPAGAMPSYPRLNQIGREKATGGTETSKYPEEEKSTEIARVAASESAPAQTRARVSGRRCRPGVAGHSSRSCPPWSGYKSGR